VTSRNLAVSGALGLRLAKTIAIISQNTPTAKAPIPGATGGAGSL